MSHWTQLSKTPQVTQSNESRKRHNPISATLNLSGSPKTGDRMEKSITALIFATVFLVVLAWYATTHRSEDESDDEK